MKFSRAIGKSLLVATAFGAAVFGVISLSAPRAEAFRPIFLCGPTILWVCHGPGGPDILFGGTICERAAFERQTGFTCVPYSG